MKFYEDDYYLNSLCMDGRFLHDFYIIKKCDDRVVEQCRRCKQRESFKLNGSNRNYLAYHIRSTLQPWQKRFKTEYLTKNISYES